MLNEVLSFLLQTLNNNLSDLFSDIFFYGKKEIVLPCLIVDIANIELMADYDNAYDIRALFSVITKNSRAEAYEKFSQVVSRLHRKNFRNENVTLSFDYLGYTYETFDWTANYFYLQSTWRIRSLRIK